MTVSFLGPLYALVTVVAWGTWLAPSQNVPFRNQQIKTFYVAAANLALALLVTLTQNVALLTPSAFWPPFLGGLIWSVSGLCAFTATERMGIARAFGIWAPLNIIVSIFWGALLFQEFIHLSPANLLLLYGSLAVILAGVLMIILPKEDAQGQAGPPARGLAIGVLGAFGAGVLWGSYYIPIKMSQVSLWVASLPLAVGIFAGSALLVAFSGRRGAGSLSRGWNAQSLLRLNCKADYLRVSATGLLWGIGNYGMLLLVDQLGAGKGFTISQLSVVINALLGVFLLKSPAPRTRAAALTLAGCVLATLGGVVLGNLK